MRVVYMADSLPEAELLRSRLAEAGIETRLRNEFLQGALGELPVNLKPEICIVKAGNFQRAREIVQSYEQELQQPLGDDWKCMHCAEDNPSNFESCWSCQNDKPL